MALLSAALVVVIAVGPGDRTASARPVGVVQCPVHPAKVHAPRKPKKQAKKARSRKIRRRTAVTPCAQSSPAKPSPAHPAPSPGAAPATSPQAATSTPSATSPTTNVAPPAALPAAAGDQAAAWPEVNAFSPTSFWNAPLSPTAPLDPSSSAFVNELVRQVNTYGAWMNTSSYSVPVYVVGPGQATVHVTLDVSAPDMQAELDAVPIPSYAQAAAGTDEHMTVWQPSSDRLWEFWKMQLESDGWHARWGGEMDDVSTNPGYFTHSGMTNDWGATATSLPLLGGLVTQSDLQRGYIDHALAIALVETEPKCWSWPAQRTDGAVKTSGITPIPEGTRFRLDPTLNLASLNLPPIVYMLAQAAQTYGIVVRDKSANVALYGQDPRSMSTNLWSQELTTYPSVLLARFPWSDLEALQTQMTCST